MKRTLIFIAAYVIASCLSFVIGSYITCEPKSFMDVISFIPLLPFINIITFVTMFAGGFGITETIVYAAGFSLFWASVVLYFKFRKTWALATLALSAILLSFNVYDLALGIMSV